MVKLTKTKLGTTMPLERDRNEDGGLVGRGSSPAFGRRGAGDSEHPARHQRPDVRRHRDFGETAVVRERLLVQLCCARRRRRRPARVEHAAVRGCRTLEGNRVVGVRGGSAVLIRRVLLFLFVVATVVVDKDVVVHVKRHFDTQLPGGGGRSGIVRTVDDETRELFARDDARNRAEVANDALHGVGDGGMPRLTLPGGCLERPAFVGRCHELDRGQRRRENIAVVGRSQRASDGGADNIVVRYVDVHYGGGAVEHHCHEGARSQEGPLHQAQCAA
mmetsp:Transcript_42402/g.130923  ORF Transcript_42402/g.130923 Transcript_42402/m.130923 type:complete len:275 (-) Transcript_42402:682-1506(-)